MSKSCPVPKKPGIYAWYFKEIVPPKYTYGCITRDNLKLLYIGISPNKPPINRKAASTQSLWHRIRHHYNGSAYGSTLRLSLGCILAERLGIELRYVGSGNRMTFSDGESALNNWLEDNAFVCWEEIESPWLSEEIIINSLSLPLNLHKNNNHPYYPILAGLRKQAKLQAKTKSVLRK